MYKRQDIEIDPHSHMVQRKGVTIDLTPIEFQILYILASHPGQAYSKERLDVYKRQFVYIRIAL